MLLRRSIFLASLTLATLSLAEDVAPLNPEPPPLSENDEVLVSTASKFDPDTTLLIESCLSVALIPVTLDERCEMTVPDYVSLQDNQTFPKSNPVVQKPSANTVQRGRGPHPIVFTSQGEAPCMTQIRPVESRPPTFEFLKAVPSQIMVPSSTTGNMVPVQLQYFIEDSCEAEEEMRCTLTLEKVLDRNDTEIFPSDQRKSEAPTKLRRKRSVEKQGGDIRGEVESRWWKVIDSHHVMISSRVPNVVGGSMKSEEGSTTALEKSGSLTYEIGVSCSFSSGVSVEKSVQVTVEEEESSKEAKEGEEGQRRVRKRRSMGEEL